MYVALYQTTLHDVYQKSSQYLPPHHGKMRIDQYEYGPLLLPGKMLIPNLIFSGLSHLETYSVFIHRSGHLLVAKIGPLH